jgi:hypothetical protein
VHAAGGRDLCQQQRFWLLVTPLGRVFACLNGHRNTGWILRHSSLIGDDTLDATEKKDSCLLEGRHVPHAYFYHGKKILVMGQLIKQGNTLFNRIFHATRRSPISSLALG